MKRLYFDEINERIYWDFTDDSCFIEPIYDDNCLSHFDVYEVPRYGGMPNLDSHCNSLKDTIFQLEMVSM